MNSNYFLNKSAKEAYRAFLLSYSSHTLKHIFDVQKIDLAALARSFGFINPPKINLDLKVGGSRGAPESAAPR